LIILIILGEEYKSRSSHSSSPLLITRVLYSTVLVKQIPRVLLQVHQDAIHAL
jgi:hypothetical protein